jgi:transcriptional regulator with GAF, ATPase, and Fis domain
MVDRGDLLVRLARGVAATAPEAPFVHRLCQTCVGLMEVDGLSLTIGATTERRLALCATDAAAERLEDLQEVLGEGPGHDVYAGGRPIQVRLPLDEPGRWPLLDDALRRQSMCMTVLALPLQSGVETYGVMTVHRDRQFSIEDQEGAQFIASAVGAAVVRDQQADSAADSAADTEPWQRRSRVHLATGMVVAQLRVAPDDALAMIRAHAFAQDVPVNQVAEEIVARRLRLSSAPEGDPTP